MTTSQPAMSHDRKSAAIELTVALAVTAILHVGVSTAVATNWLYSMPIIKHAWVFFVGTLGLAAWIRRRHGGDMSSMGIKPFNPWRRLLVIGVAGTFIALVVDTTTNPIVKSVFGPVNTQSFASLVGNLPAYLLLLGAAVVFGGFGEELHYRGIIFTRFRILFGGGRAALAAALTAQAVVFGLVHSYQGPSGMISVGILAVVDGLIFVYAGWNLWPNAIAHALIDILGFTVLFFGLMKIT